MAGVNKVIIIGRLGKDPEVRYTPSGQAVATFNVATSENWTSKASGEKQERTEWHKVVVWGKLAELCKDYLKKGRQVYVDGKLQTRSWKDKTDNTRYVTEIIANSIQFLGSSKEESSNVSDSDSKDNYTEPFEDVQSQMSDEDIPF